MTEAAVLTHIDARGVATVTLNRPQVNNAYDDEMIQGLLDSVSELATNDSVRVIVLRGNGDYFQAGADLSWMSGLAKKPLEDNIAMSKMTTDAVRFLDGCPKPTLALVHGGCFGGGIGILAACDIVIASQEAVFSITEVRWGLVAGPIIPQLNAAMGSQMVRRYALTAEKFNAATAQQMGLVHEVCNTGELDQTAEPLIEKLLQNSPSAISETKDIIFATDGCLVDDGLATQLSYDHAQRRRSADAQEGLASFKEKRRASWYPK